MSDILKKVENYSQEQYSEFAGNMTWPASKDEIVSRLRQQHAPDFVIKQAEKLPDKRYNSIGEVVKESGGSMM